MTSTPFVFHVFLFLLLISVTHIAEPTPLIRTRRGGWIPFGPNAICGCPPYPNYSLDCGCKPLQHCIGGVCTNMF